MARSDIAILWQWQLRPCQSQGPLLSTVHDDFFIYHRPFGKRYNVDLDNKKKDATTTTTLVNPKTVRIAPLQFKYQGCQVLAMFDSKDEVELCCGRNFGFFLNSMAPPNKKEDENGQSPPPPPQSLNIMTWPDPVWVQSVDGASLNQIQKRKKDSIASQEVDEDEEDDFVYGDQGSSSDDKKKEKEQEEDLVIHLEEPPKTTTIQTSLKSHGTSNQLLYVPEWNEYLGVGHFHREPK